MDTNEIDDAESKYFQEVSLYEDTADQSSGSFQGSLAVPTFSMDSSNSGRTEGCQVVGQSRGRVELSTLALQGSQGFQTLDQSAMGVQWQTMGSDSEQVSHRISGDQTVAVDMFRTGASNIQQNTTLAGIDLLEVKDTDNFLLMNAIPSDFLTKGPYTVMTSEANRMDISNTSFADSTMCNVNEPVYVQMVSAASAMESSSQETTCRSPKRRQRKSRSSSHQGSELQVSSKTDKTVVCCRFWTHTIMSIQNLFLKLCILLNFLTNKMVT